MAEPRLNCVDMSRWGGELTAKEAADLWALGVRHIIVGTGHPNGAGLWAKQQATMWLSLFATQGGTCDAYIYLVFSDPPAAQVVNALSTLFGVDIRKWWLDAEDPDAPKDAKVNTTFLIAAKSALAGRPFGIYTGQWWWKPWMDNSDFFSQAPLWNSYYDGDPDTDGLPYGGWIDSAIEQYQGTTVLAGQSVDLNYAKDLEDEAVTRTEYEDLALALFSGAEDRALDGTTLPRADRLKNALWRIQQRAEGTEQSIGSLAGSKAAAVTVPAHRHDMQIAVSATGGVIK